MQADLSSNIMHFRQISSMCVTIKEVERKWLLILEENINQQSKQMI